MHTCVPGYPGTRIPGYCRIESCLGIIKFLPGYPVPGYRGAAAACILSACATRYTAGNTIVALLLPLVAPGFLAGSPVMRLVRGRNSYPVNDTRHGLHLPGLLRGAIPPGMHSTVSSRIPTCFGRIPVSQYWVPGVFTRIPAASSNATRTTSTISTTSRI
eukprot:861003-Rhodomonas_salina.1